MENVFFINSKQFNFGFRNSFIAIFFAYLINIYVFFSIFKIDIFLDKGWTNLLLIFASIIVGYVVGHIVTIILDFLFNKIRILILLNSFLKKTINLKNSTLNNNYYSRSTIAPLIEEILIPSNIIIKDADRYEILKIISKNLSNKLKYKPFNLNLCINDDFLTIVFKWNDVYSYLDHSKPSVTFTTIRHNFFGQPNIGQSKLDNRSFVNHFSLRFTVFRLNNNLFLMEGMNFSNCPKCNRLIIQNQIEKDYTFCNICNPIRPNFIIM